MPKFKIFAGMGGGFGGPEYHMTEEYPNRDAAMKDAFDLAVEKLCWSAWYPFFE